MSAITMTFEQACELITLAEEPDLLLEAGDPVPAIDPDELRAAYQVAALFDLVPASAAIH